jgi:hypothetical protein
VRIDVSFDGVAWTEGAVYTSSNSGLDAGDYRSETLEAACFPLANATNANLTNVEGRFVRLVFGVGAADGWIGVNEVGFKCSAPELDAPTPAPTFEPVDNLTVAVTVGDDALTPCNNLAIYPPFNDQCETVLTPTGTYDDDLGYSHVLNSSSINLTLVEPYLVNGSHVPISPECAVLINGTTLRIVNDAPWSCTEVVVVATAYRGGQTATANATVEILRIVEIETHFDAYPAGSGNITHLHRMPCALDEDDYEQAAIASTATRSDGVNKAYTFRMTYVSSTPHAIVDYNATRDPQNIFEGISPGNASVGSINEVMKHAVSNTTGIDVIVATLEVVEADLTHLYEYSVDWSLQEDARRDGVAHTVKLIKGYSKQHTFDFSYTNHHNKSFTYYGLNNETRPSVDFASEDELIMILNGYDEITLLNNHFAQTRLTANLHCLNLTYNVTPWANLLPARGGVRILPSRRWRRET